MKYIKVILLFSVILSIKAAYGLNLIEDDVKWSFDVDYRYQLEKTSPLRSCIGDVYIDLIPPKDTKVVFFYTAPNHDSPEEIRIFTGVSRYVVADPDSIVKIKKTMAWRTYFRFSFCDSNDVRKYSPTYCINSYIKEDDLETLRDWASIDDIAGDEVTVAINNHQLEIDTNSAIDITAFDLNGIIMYDGIVSFPTSIPLKSSNSPYIIVKYSINGKTKTKKLVLK